MNRNAEYQALLAELETQPERLETAAQRAFTREKALQKRRRMFLTPALGLAACFTAFVVLVNLSIPFASACGRIPWLRELAKAVAFSPSLSAAVENEYVQPIGETKTESGITVTVEYVIVDRKQLNIFYTAKIPEDQELYVDYDYEMDDLHSWAGSSGSAQLTSGELQQIKLEFVESDVPASLGVRFGFYDQEAWRQAEPDSFLSEMPKYREPDHLAEFFFHLEFDPYYTAQGEVIPVDSAFTLDGQRFTLTEVELYPTHLRVNLTADADNTAWLKGLELYLENEYGERFERPGGLTAAGDSEGAGMATFWLDSTFFSRGQHLTLHITQAQWKDKDAPRVRLNLADGTVENLPQGVRLLRVERQGSGWSVGFVKDKARIGDLGNLMSCGGFWDEDGNHYDIWQSGSTIGYQDPETGEWVEDENLSAEDFTLIGLSGDAVYLDPSSNRVTNFDIPITIPIK